LHDVEDGQPSTRKPKAGGHCTGNEGSFSAFEQCIRINSIGSGSKRRIWQHVGGNPFDCRAEDRICRTGEMGHDRSSRELEQAGLGSIRLLLAETAKGILNLKEIAEADKRLEAIIFGGEDFAASIGALRTKDATELLYARQAVVTACAANDLQAIDIVFIDFKEGRTPRRSGAGSRIRLQRETDHSPESGCGCAGGVHSIRFSD
jgi:citrate lyase beta subunit